jgi:NCAIR mutase (PurE)-related protein
VKNNHSKLDFDRFSRIGLEEAIYCEFKTGEQVNEILKQFFNKNKHCLLTKLSAEKLNQIDSLIKKKIDYCSISNTAFFNYPNYTLSQNQKVAVLCAGTSDLSVAYEAMRTLSYYGKSSLNLFDIGVSGLWRLTEKLEQIRTTSVVITIAGMEAALPTVLGGLISQPIIAVPTSVGYGVSKGGHTALNALLASCSSGITVVNIDNGYGAACAALRILKIT